VAGLRAVAALPAAGPDLAECATLADTLLADTARSSLHPDGYWQRAPDNPGLDASLLLPPVRGALPADDPRTRTTLRAALYEIIGTAPFETVSGIEGCVLAVLAVYGAVAFEVEGVKHRTVGRAQSLLPHSYS